MSKYYQIIVEGKIDPGWSDWFNGMTIISRMDAEGEYITILSGAAIDQVALRGLLSRLWDLNLTVRSVSPINSEALKMDKGRFSEIFGQHPLPKNTRPLEKDDIE
jgi:hypothetical protein